METLASLVQGLTEGSVTVVDLTQPLSEETPLIRLPEPFVNTPGWKLHELSRYDERGPAWYWNAFEGGEHMGPTSTPRSTGQAARTRTTCRRSRSATSWASPW
jgi:hypothetical protein